MTEASKNISNEELFKKAVEYIKEKKQIELIELLSDNKVKRSIHNYIVLKQNENWKTNEALGMFGNSDILPEEYDLIKLASSNDNLQQIIKSSNIYINYKVRENGEVSNNNVENMDNGITCVLRGNMEAMQDKINNRHSIVTDISYIGSYPTLLFKAACETDFHYEDNEIYKQDKTKSKEIQLNMVKLLVENGADVFVRDWDNKPLLECIKDGDIKKYIEQEQKRQYVSRLKDYIEQKNYMALSNLVNEYSSEKYENEFITGSIDIISINNYENVLIQQILAQNGDFARDIENIRKEKEAIVELFNAYIQDGNIDKIYEILINESKKKYIDFNDINMLKKLVKVRDGGENSRKTLLFKACEENNTELVKFLVENGADVVRSYSKNSDILGVITDVDLKKYMEEVMIREYVQKGGHQNVEKICQGSSNREHIASVLNQRDENGETLLFRACKQKNIELISTLIKYGADVTIKNNEGKQIFDYVNVSNNDNSYSEYAELYSEYMTNLYCVNYNNTLNNYIENKTFNKEVFNNLLGDNHHKNRILNLQDENGETLLFKACKMGDIDSIQLLLENGADVSLKNNEEESVIDILEKDKDNMNKKIIKGIIQGYIKNNEQNNKRDIITDDLQGIEQTEEEIEKLYNEISGFIRLKNNVELIKVLNESKNKPYIKQALNTKNTNGDSIFQLACQYGFDNKTLYLLVQNGADIFIRNNLNKDALDNVNNSTTKKYLDELIRQKVKSQAEEYIANKNYYSLSLLVKYHGKILWEQIKKEDFLNNVNENVNENEKDIIYNIFKAESIIESINNVSIKQNNIDIRLSNSDAYNKALECILNQDYYNLSLILNEYRRDIIEATHNGDERVVLADILSDVVHRKQKKNSGYNLVDVAYLCNDNIVKQILEEAKIYKNVIGLEELDRKTRVNNYRNIIEFCIKNNKKEKLEQIFKNENSKEDRMEFLIEALNIKDKNGETLLFEACRQGNIDIVKLLVENGADVFIENNMRQSVLYGLDNDGIYGYIVNEQQKQIDQKMISAIEDNNYALFTRLYSYKCSFDTEHNFKTDNEIANQIMESFKSKVNKDSFDRQDMQLKVINGTNTSLKVIGFRDEIVNGIVNYNNLNSVKNIFDATTITREEKINVLNSIQESSRESILITACKQGNIEVIDFLIKNGADIYLQDLDGKNIFDYIDSGKIEFKDEVKKYLIECDDKKVYEKAVKSIKDKDYEILSNILHYRYDSFERLQELDGGTFNLLNNKEVISDNVVLNIIKSSKLYNQEQLKENEQELKQDDILENNAESNFSQYVEENLKQEEVKQSEKSVQMLQNEDRKEAQEQVEQQMEQSTQDEEQLQNINTQENVQPQQQPQQELKNNTEINNNQEKVIELYNNIDKLIKENKYGEINNIINDEKNKEYIKDVLNFKPDETAETFLNYKDSITGENLLFKILVHGNVDTFKILVDNGVDAFAKNKSGNTIFNVLKYEDILNNDSVRVQKTKENQNTKNIQIGNYLVRKCIEGDKLYEFQNAFDKQNNKQDERIINEILNLQDEKGETLLFEACRNGNIEVVKLLVEKGANVNIKNNEGKNVLDYTDENQEIREYLEEQIQKDKEQKQGGIITKNITQQNQEKEEEVVINNNTKSKHNAQELVEGRINNNQERVIEDQNINIINNDKHSKQNEDIVINTNQNNKSELDNGIYKNKVNNTIDNINSKERQLERGQVNNSLEQEKVIELYDNINELIKEKKYGEINNIINNEKNREFIRDVLKLQDENGETLLFQACRSGNIQVVELLLNKEGEFDLKGIDILNTDGKSILNVLDEKIEQLGEENSSDIKVIRGYIRGYVDKYVKENMPLKWSEIGKNIKYKQKGIANNKDVVTHKDAQQQVYQIAHYYANNPIKDIDQNKTYAISDTHGDMGALLESLLRSGIVEFVNPEEPCIVVVNNDNPDNKILIPNVKLTENSNGNKLVVLGDIIDRGYQSDSCMMLMKHLMNQQTQQKSNNIIFTVGNHEDVTINDKTGNAYFLTLDENSVKQGENKDHNTARDIFKDMVEQDQMLFCYYDENTNTIYSHVPFDIGNTVNALNFIQNNKNKFSKQTQQNVDKIVNDWSKNNNYFKGNKEGVKQLVDVFNELYKYECEYGNEELHYNVYEKEANTGLLWNRDYTKDDFEAIPGINCVCGHDPKGDSQEVQINKDGSIVNVDTLRSCGYTTDKNKVGLVEISQGENGKLSHKVLEDIGHIKYSEDLKTIETINETKPVILQNNTVFIKKNINSLVSKDLSKQEIQTDNVKQQQENNIKTQLTKKEKKELKKEQKRAEKQQKQEEKEIKKREKEEKKKQKNKEKMQNIGTSGGKHGNNQILSRRKHRYSRFRRFFKRIIDLFHLFFKDDDKSKEQRKTNIPHYNNNYGSGISHSYPETNKTVTKKKGIKHFKESVQNMWEKYKENEAIKKEIKKLNKELIREVVNNKGSDIEGKDIRGEINTIYFNSVAEYTNKNYNTNIEKGRTQVNISQELQDRVNKATKRIDNYYKTYKSTNKQISIDEETDKRFYGDEIYMYATEHKFNKSLRGIETNDPEKSNKNFIKKYKGTIKKAKKESSNTMSM